MKNSLINSKKFLQSAVVLLVMCVLVLVFVILKPEKIGSKNKIVHDSKDYTLTSPILDCEAVEQGEESVVPRNKVLDKVESLKKEYGIKFISIYFRDLNNGPWLGINEKESFVPASLLKTPLVMSLLRFAQNKPEVLDRKITVTEEDIKEAYPQNENSALLQLESGKEYSLDEISTRTIKYSDNRGVPILLKNLPLSYMDDLYASIGGLSIDENVRVKDYASFFRVLYNASYLNRDMSEKMLSILSKTEYKTGMVAGVPDDVIVAHKFGEYTSDEVAHGGLELPTTDVQLHDCGIIYYPERPYILCIMTRGQNFNNQEKTIAEISRFFYEQVDKSRD